MATTLTIGIGLLLAGAICLQLVFAWQHFRARHEARSDDAFEKDVEWQLQNELDNAIAASSKPSTPLLESKIKSYPPLAPKVDAIAHIHFANSQPPPGSYAELRSHYGGMNRGHLTGVQQSLHDSESQHRTGQPYSGQLESIWITASDPLVPNDSTHINPKQLQRIQKRRLARAWIENYFEERKDLTERPRTRISVH